MSGRFHYQKRCITTYWKAERHVERELWHRRPENIDCAGINWHRNSTSVIGPTIASALWVILMIKMAYICWDCWKNPENYLVPTSDTIRKRKIPPVSWEKLRLYFRRFITVQVKPTQTLCAALFPFVNSYQSNISYNSQTLFAPHSGVKTKLHFLAHTFQLFQLATINFICRF